MADCGFGSESFGDGIIEATCEESQCEELDLPDLQRSGVEEGASHTDLQISCVVDSACHANVGLAAVAGDRSDTHEVQNIINYALTGSEGSPGSLGIKDCVADVSHIGLVVANAAINNQDQDDPLGAKEPEQQKEQKTQAHKEEQQTQKEEKNNEQKKEQKTQAQKEEQQPQKEEKQKGQKKEQKKEQKTQQQKQKTQVQKEEQQPQEGKGQKKEQNNQQKMQQQEQKTQAQMEEQQPRKEEETKTAQKKEYKQVDLQALRSEWMDVWKQTHAATIADKRELQKQAAQAWIRSQEREYLVSCYSEAERKRRRLS